MLAMGAPHVSAGTVRWAAVLLAARGRVRPASGGTTLSGVPLPTGWIQYCPPRAPEARASGPAFLWTPTPTGLSGCVVGPAETPRYSLPDRPVRSAISTTRSAVTVCPAADCPIVSAGCPKASAGLPRGVTTLSAHRSALLWTYGGVTGSMRSTTYHYVANRSPATGKDPLPGVLGPVPSDWMSQISMADVKIAFLPHWCRDQDCLGRRLLCRSLSLSNTVAHKLIQFRGVSHCYGENLCLVLQADNASMGGMTVISLPGLTTLVVGWVVLSYNG